MIKFLQGPIRTPYEYVSQPAFIHAIIAQLEDQSIWKLAMYFTNPNFTQAPMSCDCSSFIETPTVPDMVQFEMYNLTNDPWETQNLADVKYETSQNQAIRNQLMEILQEQLQKKALNPVNSTPFLRELPVPS